MPKAPSTNPQGNWPLVDFQARFVEEFLKPGSPRYQRLVSPVGTGKQFTTVRVISRLFSEGAERVLVLSPVALVASWHQQIADAVSEREALHIGRRFFLELQSQAQTDDVIWPKSTIVMSVDMAKREDVASTLATTTWDLVVVDEAHAMTGQRRRLLDMLITSEQVARLLLLTATPSEESLPDNSAPVLTTDWTDIVASWRMERAPSPPEMALRLIHYTRGTDEVGFAAALDAFLQELPGTPQANMARSSMLKSASSCIFNLERTLLRIRRQLQGTGFGEELSDVEASAEEIVEHEGIWADLPDCLARVEGLLELLSNVASDGKLAALRGVLDDLVRGKSDRRATVMTSFLGTAEYLMNAIAEADVPAFLVTGSVPLRQREEAFRMFRDSGQALVATDAALMGIDLSFTDVVIHYDLPSNLKQMEQRRGRYDRMSRTTPCTVCAFIDASGAFPFESELMRRIGLAAQAQGDDCG